MPPTSSPKESPASSPKESAASSPKESAASSPKESTASSPMLRDLTRARPWYMIGLPNASSRVGPMDHEALPCQVMSCYMMLWYVYLWAVSELTLKASAKRVEIVEDAQISSCGRGGKMPVAKLRSPLSTKSPQSSESSASWWNSGTGPLEQLSCLWIRALLEIRS